jgi:hypothetical protein
MISSPEARHKYTPQAIDFAYSQKNTYTPKNKFVHTRTGQRKDKVHMR